MLHSGDRLAWFNTGIVVPLAAALIAAPLIRSSHPLSRSQRRIHATVQGRVQMVGFRYFVVERARALGLTGWVRNSEDGTSVEVVAEGEVLALRRLEEALKSGPPSARVDNVAVDRSAAVEGYATFEARF